MYITGVINLNMVCTATIVFMIPEYITGVIYLNMVCTATIVLQSASVSSSAALELSLFAITKWSARLTPALNRSSRLHKKRDKVW